MPQSFRAIVEERNRRSVWTIATRPFPEAHFATFPPELVEPCVMAGTSERGCCAACRSPWQRITAPSERYLKFLGRGFTDHAADGEQGMMQSRGVNRQNAMINEEGLRTKETETVGWWPTCECDGLGDLPPLPKRPRLDRDEDADGPLSEEEKLQLEVLLEEWREACKPVYAVWRERCAGVRDVKTVPAVVMDFFGGSGTVGMVADRLQRDSILIEAKPGYVEMIRRRIGADELPLFPALDAAE